MPVSFISNSAATISRQNLNAATTQSQRSISKISSGQRVFSAKEDAGSLAIGTGLRIDTAVMRSAATNVQSGSAMLQIADGALGNIQDILTRMQSLATQAASGQISNVQRGFLNAEYQGMLEEIDRIAGSAEFSGLSLFGGTTDIQLNTVGANVGSAAGFVAFEFESFVDPSDVFEVDYTASTQVLTLTSQATGAVQTLFVDAPQPGALNTYNFSRLGVEVTLNSDFDTATDITHAGAGEQFNVTAAATATAQTYEMQIGNGTDAADRLTVNLPLVNVDALGFTGSTLTTATNAETARDLINSAVESINLYRSELGAQLNRLEVAANNIQVSIENSENARSGLLDVDIAAEMTTLAVQQVLLESSTAMLAEANAQPDRLLQLLR